MTIVRREQVHDTLYRHGLVAYGFLGIIALCFLVLWGYLLRYLVQPLSLLLEGIRNFTRGNTEVQIPRIGKDELGELQEAFNEMSREITVERKKLRNESQSDALTGLFNMRYFRIQLAEEFSRSQRYGRPLTLLMIDVDNFKAYNDRNGHPAGDIVLKEVSRIFIRNVRGTDIVARYGGEEFVVLLPETPLDAGVSVAEKIRRAVEEHYFPFAASQGGQKVTVSIGVASYPDVHVTSDQDLIESSDKALYSAKKDGRNRVYISSKTEGNISFAIYQSAEKTVAGKK
jgi:diguanylate cyclase (GGDEF)-like protein